MNRSPNLLPFLQEDLSIRALAACRQPPNSGNGQSRASFESRTAAINVTPSASSEYDIQQIKDDVQWLSKRASIDEVTALRIAVLEYQGRAAGQIREGYTEEESMSVQRAVSGASSFRTPAAGLASSFGGYAHHTLQPDGDQANVDPRRRARLLRMLFAEQEWMLAVAVHLEGARYEQSPSRIPSQAKTHSQKNGQPKGSNLSAVGAKIHEARIGHSHAGSSQSQDLLQVFEGVERYLQAMTDGRDMTLLEDMEPLFEAELSRHRLRELFHILRLAFITAKSAPHLRSTAAISLWFRIMDGVTFFERFEVAEIAVQHTVRMIQALASLISFVLLDHGSVSENVFPHISEPDSQTWYGLDGDCSTQICRTLVNAAANGVRSASLPLLSWGIIAETWRSRVRDSQDDSVDQDDLSRTIIYPGGLNAILDVELPYDDTDKDTSTKDPILWLAQNAVDELEVFSSITTTATVVQELFDPMSAAQAYISIRHSLLDALRLGCMVSQYNPEALEAAFSVLDSTVVDQCQTGSGNMAVDAVVQDCFLQDSLLRSALLKQALSRYPFEVLPLLKLCQSLSRSVATDEDNVPLLTQALREAPKFTQQMPRRFEGYELVREDESANTIRLTQHLPFFTSSRNGLKSSSMLNSGTVNRSTDLAAAIPRGTGGRALTETKPHVVMWEYKHSILVYLANALGTAMKGRNLIDAATGEPIGRDVQNSSIRTFTRQVEILTQISRLGNNRLDRYQIVRQILEEASDGLERDQDIISVVASILEQELPSQAQQNDEASVEIMTSCVQFLRSVLPAMPGRVWPVFARNGLLDLDGSGGKLVAVVSAVEMSTGNYDFLTSCLGLFEALVEDVVSNAITRMHQSTSLVKRFEENPSFDTMLPQKTMSTILLAFARLFADVLRNSQDWRFEQPNQGLEINSRVVDMFERVVGYVYPFHDSHEPSKGLSASLMPAADFLMSIFLGPAASGVTASSLLRLCEKSVESPVDTLPYSHRELVQAQTRHSLRFMTLLLTISEIKEQPSTGLQLQLFQAMPLFVRLYASRYSQKAAVAKLLATLVRCAGEDDKEPPSLFGSVGNEVARNAIDMFSELARPLDDIETELAVWDFLAAVVGSRQQWFATYLLTGSTPQKSLASERNRKDNQNGRTPVLEVALDKLLELQALDSPRAVALLQFVLDAINHWPWSVSRVQSHNDFLNKMARHTTEISVVPKTKRDEDALRLAYQTKCVSLLTEIFAMYLYTTRIMGHNSFRKNIVENICFFKGSCVEDPAYSQSLHDRLKKNFESRFPGCVLDSFRRLLPRARFGQDYFYDLGFASETFRFHAAWAGRAKEAGFEREFRSANVNLSLVEAQVQSLTSWRTLAIELSTRLQGDLDLQKKLAYVVHECLAANRASSLQAALFENLKMTRVELALPVLQQLVDRRAQAGPMQSLLPEVWKTIGQSETDFDLVFVGDAASYYRILLRLLLLSLRPHIYTPAKDVNGQSTTASRATSALDYLSDTDKTTLLLEVTHDIVARGFRSLCAQLHEQANSVLPSDFGLLTALFQSLLLVRVREISRLHDRIAETLAHQNVARYATALFSWSDRLTAPNDDPVFGELSISFLLEMSSIPSLAASLASDGLLSQLNTTNLMAYYRRPGGTGPSEEPQRIHKIWARGILPLCLNLALAAGAAFVPEVATFLNNFSPQLARAADGLDAKAVPSPANSTAGTMTLNAAAEAHTLALLCVGLERARDASGEEVPQLEGWDRAGVKEDLEVWMGMTRAGFRERVVPSSEGEVGLLRAKPSDGGECGCENRLEEMVLVELKGALFVLGGGS